ncbi:hypothetical protein B0H14DRAFT_955580 [Mycena olivaceomarginata]|nr:hypothetical protein B0H14DRAFT_955580 [Mycena olivaceomarginata]
MRRTLTQISRTNSRSSCRRRGDITSGRYALNLIPSPARPMPRCPRLVSRRVHRCLSHLRPPPHRRFVGGASSDGSQSSIDTQVNVILSNATQQADVVRQPLSVKYIVLHTGFWTWGWNQTSPIMSTQDYDKNVTALFNFLLLPAEPGLTEPPPSLSISMGFLLPCILTLRYTTSTSIPLTANSTNIRRLGCGTRILAIPNARRRRGHIYKLV